jgi:BirA family biotin operon repressor/biotin-[acetyl-CoA-carboxylase] ligase
VGDPGAPGVPGGRASPLGSWRFWEVATVDSTNDVAAGLPAWHAVRADRQRAGRGRHRRTWVSDAGGMWMSAVVPTGPPEAGWAALPLAAGWAVCAALEGFGVPSPRLRWPNDVLVGRRKIAGLLADVFRPGLAVVGIGVNVANRPEEDDPALAGQVARVAEWAEPVPDLRAVAGAVLRRLEEAVSLMTRDGFAALVPRVNDRWQAPRPVRVELDSGVVDGWFEAVDAAGRLRLRQADGGLTLHEPHRVTMLRERD